MDVSRKPCVHAMGDGTLGAFLQGVQDHFSRRIVYEVAVPASRVWRSGALHAAG